MQSQRKRKISSGKEYEALFPEANMDTQTILKSAEVSDTVAFIPKVVYKTLHHTQRLAKVLKGVNEYETCRNIWEFVYQHIAYAKDRDGYEQIRSPARTWHDRGSGVDCDCYSTFISSVLINSGIKHQLRITKYNYDYFQHIYPIAILQNGRQVAIDCVTEQFDYEVPYREKKDYPMELQYLNGIEGAENLDFVHYAYGNDGEGLGKHKKKKHQHEDFEDFMEHGDTVPAYGVRKKKGVKKLLNFVNKFNPTTTLLRNGVLASTKLNIAKIGSKMRWTYLTPNQARAKHMDMARWKKLVQVRQKLDNIFYGAGGKPENLKKAILKGKGNKDKSVHGLEGVGNLEHSTTDLMGLSSLSTSLSTTANTPDEHEHHYDQHSSLQQLLGSELYHTEHEALNTLSALGDLGEPITMASIASASGVIAAIAKMLRKVGDVFKGSGKGSSDFSEHSGDGNDTPSDTDGSNGGDNSKGGDGSENGDNNGGDGNGDDNGGTGKTGKKSSKKGGSITEIDNTDTGNPQPANETGVKGFIDNNKKWLIPTAVGIGGLTAIGIGMHAMSGKHPSKPLNGHPHKKHKSPFHKTEEHPKKLKHQGRRKKIKKITV